MASAHNRGRTHKSEPCADFCCFNCDVPMVFSSTAGFPPRRKKPWVYRNRSSRSPHTAHFCVFFLGYVLKPPLWSPRNPAYMPSRLIREGSIFMAQMSLVHYRATIELTLLSQRMERLYPSLRVQQQHLGGITMPWGCSGAQIYADHHASRYSTSKPSPPIRSQSGETTPHIPARTYVIRVASSLWLCIAACIDEALRHFNN